MAREELISSAVSFLQDPSVASSPVEKRIAFLQSKNLTQEEIDLALSRAGDESSSASTTSSQGYSAPQQSVYRPPPPAQGYGYPPYNQWQPPPPELPKRDWRDWFIMATVMGGVGYGLYSITKRYISPLISPPTPPQLEQDKASIDEQFSRAFTLIEQLSTDTAALKSAEEARSERLDAALREVETLVTDLKTSSRRRDDETRRISDEVKSLKDAIPKAMEGAREGNENRLRELGTELKSLKVLLGNRLGGSGGSSSPASGRLGGAATPVSASPRPVDESPTAPTSGTAATSTEQPSQPSSTGASQSTPAQGSSSVSNSPLSQLGRSASIPAWQMAAANRSKGASQPAPAPSVEDATPTASTDNVNAPAS